LACVSPRWLSFHLVGFRFNLVGFPFTSLASICFSVHLLVACQELQLVLRPRFKGAHFWQSVDVLLHNTKRLVPTSVCWRGMPEKCGLHSGWPAGYAIPTM
jgi:hypothetical protein